TSLALAALLLVAGTIVSTWQARRAEDARQRAEDLRALADRAATRAALSAARIAAEHHDYSACERELASVVPTERGWVWHGRASRADARIAHLASAEPLSSAAFVPGVREVVAVDAAGTLTRWAPGETAAHARLDLGTRLTGPAAFDREARFVAGAHG